MQVNAHVSMYSFFSSKLVVCNARDALGTLLMDVLCFGKLRSKNIIQVICYLFLENFGRIRSEVMNAYSTFSGFGY